jgi:hypothetical protein
MPLSISITVTTDTNSNAAWLLNQSETDNVTVGRPGPKADTTLVSSRYRLKISHCAHAIYFDE